MNRFSIAFLALLISTSCSAQWINYTYYSPTGLKGSIVSSITQDDRNNIWFATDAGVTSYNVADKFWKNYTTSDGLSNNAVNKLFFSESKVLWVATNNGGASMLDRFTNKWINYNMTNGLAGNTVRDIAEDGSGNLWFATYGYGVSKKSGSSWQNINTSNGLISNLVNAIFADNSGNIWFGTTSGVSKFDGNNWTNYTIADGLPSNLITHISQDNSGDIWFGTNSGAAKLNGNVFAIFNTTNGLSGNEIRSVFKDKTGKIFFATDSGLSIFYNSVWASYSTSTGLSSNDVASVFKDSLDNLWVGYFSQGVSLFNGTSWTHMNSNQSLPYSIFSGLNDMAEDNNHNLWVGTSYGIVKFDGNNWVNLVNTPIGQSTITCMTKGVDGAIWFGTPFGLHKHYNGAWTKYSSSNGLSSNYIYSLFTDSKGNVWAGTNLGASIVSGTSIKNYTYANRNTHFPVTSICEDMQGRIWFSCQDFIVINNYESWSNYFPFANYVSATNSKPKINKMITDGQSNVWLATTDGAFRITGKNITRFSEPLFNSFNSNIETITCDISGGIWFGVMNKISRFINNQWDYYTDLNSVIPYGTRKIFSDSKGAIWISHGSTLSKGIFSLLGTEHIVVDDKFQFNAYPNPFSISTSIKFTLDKSCTVSLIIYDMQGREVSVLLNEVMMEQGKQEITYSQNDLKNGIYFCKISYNNTVQSIKILKF